MGGPRPVAKVPTAETFAILAEALHPAGRDEDLVRFRAAKGRRAALVHRFEDAEGPFPAAAVVGLLAAHLHRSLDEGPVGGSPPGPVGANLPGWTHLR